MIDARCFLGPDGLYPPEIADLLVDASPEKLAILVRIGKAVVEHDRYLRAMDWLEGVYSEFKVGRESTGGLMIGQPGVGKSTVLRRFVRAKGGPFETSEGSKRPVIRVVTPADPRPGEIFDRLLIALGASDMIMGNVADRKSAATDQIGKQGVRLIVFDEFTHVVEDRSEKFTKKLSRELKEFLSEGHCQLVMAGTQDLDRLPELYPQMRRRSGGDFVLTPFDWEDDQDRIEWIGIMELVDDLMVLKSDKRLHDAKMARNLHRASAGNLDNLMKLLLRASSIAFEEGVGRIDVGLMADAFERMRRGDKKTDNPFGNPTRRSRKPKLVEDDYLPEDDYSGLSKRSRRDGETFATS